MYTIVSVTIGPFLAIICYFSVSLNNSQCYWENKHKKEANCTWDWPYGSGCFTAYRWPKIQALDLLIGGF